MTEHK